MPHAVFNGELQACLAEVLTRLGQDLKAPALHDPESIEKWLRALPRYLNTLTCALSSSIGAF